MVRQNQERFRVYSLVAGRNSHLLLSQIQEFLPKVVVVADDVVKDQLAAGLAKSSLERKHWPDGIFCLVHRLTDSDINSCGRPRRPMADSGDIQRSAKGGRVRDAR